METEQPSSSQKRFSLKSGPATTSHHNSLQALMHVCPPWTMQKFVQKKTFKYINTIHCLYIRDSLLAILCVYCVNHRRVLLFSPPKWCSTIQRAKAKRSRISPCFQTVFHGYLIPNVTQTDAFGRVSWQCNTSHLVPLTQTHRFSPNPLTRRLLLCCSLAEQR